MKPRKIEKIKKQVYDAYVDAQPEFKLVSVPLKLDERQQKEIEGLLDKYRQLTLEKILMLISVDKDLIPNIDRIRKLTEDQASTFTLQWLISKSCIGWKKDFPTNIRRRKF
ncbi:hypothetical protein [Paenibacillus agaridevorans]|uniref:hypothetical protein n=1 Tax=Paenibacillus agaridevorans TaxID=171404 RepID=UPI001BE490DD|nr:hypothetical protein [Paenibacillus agaridevorans]